MKNETDNPRSFVEIAQAYTFDEKAALEEAKGGIWYVRIVWNIGGVSFEDKTDPAHRAYVVGSEREHARSHAREMKLAALLDQAVEGLRYISEFGANGVERFDVHADELLDAIESGRAKLLTEKGRGE